MTAFPGTSFPTLASPGLSLFRPSHTPESPDEVCRPPRLGRLDLVGGRVPRHCSPRRRVARAQGPRFVAADCPVPPLRRSASRARDCPVHRERAARVDQRPVRRTCLTDVDLDADHKQWIAPLPTDERGPCPGLNAAANHGYLPHDGIATYDTVTHGLFKAYGLGNDSTQFLMETTTFFDGDPLAQVRTYSTIVLFRARPRRLRTRVQSLKIFIELIGHSEMVHRWILRQDGLPRHALDDAGPGERYLRVRPPQVGGRRFDHAW